MSKQKKKHDFSGWATKFGLQCSDGRIISGNAFKHNNGIKVPLVWNHNYEHVGNILGHAILEHRESGMYAYGYFNTTVAGTDAKECLKNGDINSLSIHANQLRQNGNNVVHGNIKEVSLVLAGANPGAKIEDVIFHTEDSDGVAFIYNDISDLEINHSEEPKLDPVSQPMTEQPIQTEETPIMLTHADDNRTIQDVWDSMSKEQQEVALYLIGELSQEKEMKQGENMENLFENNNSLTHSGMGANMPRMSEEEFKAIIEGAQKSNTSLKHMFMENGFTTIVPLNKDTLSHSITDVDYLFPDSKTVMDVPSFITREMGWVKEVLNACHRTPFSRVKSIHANLTGDEARAKGYIKSEKKAEQVFSLLKRETSPQTVYKTQAMDRDDIIDITDFDVILWIKKEMRFMLEEELARAILVGDGRLASANDAIKTDKIRPIWTDATDLYTVPAIIPITSSSTENDIAKASIRTMLKARKNYKGAGNLTLFTTEDFLTDLLLLEDKEGRPLYDTEEKLKTALRVKNIITVPVMDGLTRTVDSKTRTLKAIGVNLKDYNIGADKGGAVSLFDDFDIEYNKERYLIETRMSGAMVTPFAAIILETELATVDPAPGG